MKNRIDGFAGVVELTQAEAREVVGGPTAVEYAVMLALRLSANQGSQLGQTTSFGA